MHNALKERLGSKLLQPLHKVYFRKTSGSYCSNSNILLLQAGYKLLQLNQKTALKLKPSLP